MWFSTCWFLVSACLAGGENCPDLVPVPRAKPRLVCLPEQGRHAACSIRKSIRDVTSSTPPPTSSCPRGKQRPHGIDQTPPQHANPGKRYVRSCGTSIWRIGQDTAALHHALEARPHSLIYPPAVVPLFGPPFLPFPVLLGWEWVQTECEVIAKMPLLVPIKHSQPRSQHGSCFCSPSASAVVWAMPTTHRGVSQCSAPTAPLRDLVPAW